VLVDADKIRSGCNSPNPLLGFREVRSELEGLFVDRRLATGIDGKKTTAHVAEGRLNKATFFKIARDIGGSGLEISSGYIADNKAT
jgi:hypothetical protein